MQRPVSTQENKHWIGSDCSFFNLVFIHMLTARPKKVENTLTLYHCGSQVQAGTENWYRKPMRRFNFVQIRCDPMFIFLSGIGLKADFIELHNQKVKSKHVRF